MSKDYKDLIKALDNAEFYFEKHGRNKRLACKLNDGTVLSNCTAIAGYFGINPTTLSNRMYYTKNPYKLIYHLVYDKYIGDSKSKYYYTTEDGELLVGVAKIAEYFGIDNKVLYYRLKNGETIEKAIEDILSKKAITQFVAEDGTTFKTLTEVANYYNLNRSYLKIFVKDEGIPLSEAIKFCPKKEERQSIIYNLENGDTLIGITSVANYFGLKRDVVRALIKANYSIEKYISLRNKNDINK